MREILFRGKRKDNGEWVEGGYYIEPYTGDVSITFWNSFGLGFMDNCKVASESVGQFTGLTDKNGKEIFEGDIVLMPYEYSEEEKLRGYYGYDEDGYPQKIPGYGGYGKYDVTKRGKKGCEVVFHPTHGFYAKDTSFALSGIDVEVIGNIHDNPELLEVADE